MARNSEPCVKLLQLNWEPGTRGMYKQDEVIDSTTS